jgi:hypothetical protein
VPDQGQPSSSEFLVRVLALLLLAPPRVLALTRREREGKIALWQPSRRRE